MDFDLPRPPKLRNRHRALAGILAGIIMFAAVFTTGFGFFLYVTSSGQNSNQANIQRANLALQAGSEKDSIVAHINIAGELWVRANNTGGVSSTISDVYVTCQSGCGLSGQGQLVSNSLSSPGSHFLKDSPLDLNTSLPITLGVGASTRYQGDIGISRAAFTYLPGEYVVVSVLTSLGNVFSAQYPPPPLTSTTFVSVKSLNTSIALKQIGGGPQLSVLMSATARCPSGGGGCTQTFSCTNGCITVNATIYNLATTPANGVSLYLHTPYSDFVSGTASVSLYSACTPATVNIPAGSQVSIACQFSALTGATGGLASFSGYVSGTLGSVLVTSAEALSNAIEIGGLASVTTQGVFAANFFFLKYSSCYQNTASNFNSPCTTNVPMPPSSVNNLPSGSFLAGGSNFYVAFYMQITNVFNTTVPILQYSYTFGDPTISGEVYYFLAGSNTTMTNGAYYPSYTGTPTLVGYPTDCNANLNANGIPKDSNCITVKPGQTVTLTFAACGYGSTNWAWGGYRDAKRFDGGALCTGNPPNLSVPEGMVLGIVVSFLYKGVVYSQLMPFEGQAYLRSSATTLSCSPSTVGSGNPTICTAKVTDTDGSGTTLKPTGLVTFSGPALGLGTFTSTSCTLSSGSCSVTYTPSLTTQGPVAMTATYQGNPYYAGSSGSTTLTVVHPTTTAVSCVPSTLVVNNQTTCTATVTDVSGAPTTPTGTVKFTASKGGTFSTSVCTLVGSGAVASCVTKFTPGPGSEGSITITGTYNGDTGHASSSGTATLTATKRTTSTTVTCSLTTVPQYSATSCMVTVTDTSPGTPITPTGKVSFSANPSSGGYFTSTTCTLSSGSCSVNFIMGLSSGTVTITANYPGDTNHLSSSGSTTLTGAPGTGLRASTTTVVCSPSTLPVNSQTTCTVTVSDVATGTKITPTGTVTYTAPSGAGTFSPASAQCTLAGSGGTATCALSFTPGLGQEGSITITASYPGDANHPPSTGSTTITATKRTTSTSVSCTPVTGGVGTPRTCTATVVDTSSGTAVTPTGTVKFSVSPSGHGNLTPPSCILSAGTCSITYTPTSAGSVTVTSSYQGDTDHYTSSGSTTVSPGGKNTTTTSISCSPNPFNFFTTCTVTVTDTAASPITPTGTVTWTTNDPTYGSFIGGSSCTLSGSGASATCTVEYQILFLARTDTLTATYGGDTFHLGSSGKIAVTSTGP